MTPEVPAERLRRGTRYTARMKIAPLWLSLCVAGMLVACGQKGPLVHPDAPKHKRVAPSPRTPSTPATGAPAAGAPVATDPPPKP
jgi:predicted small lipoprotein YifL